MTEDIWSIEMLDICKYFGSVKANDHIDLRVKRGDIHAIVGENGAGKTTLMNILFGIVSPNSGTIRINGKEVKLKGTIDALQHGIGMVHQHFKLVPEFTVAENIFLGKEQIKKTRFVDIKKMNQDAAEISKQFALAVEVESKVEDLSVGLLQRVEILKALSRGAEILILDEPTAVLTPLECSELFTVLKRMREQGKTIIVITHKLKEVIEISDNITVLSKGKTKGTVATANTSVEKLSNLMIDGSGNTHVFNRTKWQEQGNLLDVHNLCVADEKGQQKIHDLSFSLKAGEILTIAGVEGNGQTELVSALLGLKKVTGGSIIACEANITGASVKERRTQCAFIPEDRIKTGLNGRASFHDNAIAGHMAKRGVFLKGPFILQKQTRKFVKNVIAKYDIKTASQQIAVKSLSGGNQQKIVVARELEFNKKILIVSQPSRGVDIGAARFIHQQLVNKRNQGQGILLISTDLDEVFALSDRIAVLFNGKIVGVFSPNEITPEALGLYMTGVKEQSEEMIRERVS